MSYWHWSCILLFTAVHFLALSVKLCTRMEGFWVAKGRQKPSRLSLLWMDTSRRTKTQEAMPRWASRHLFSCFQVVSARMDKKLKYPISHPVEMSRAVNIKWCPMLHVTDSTRRNNAKSVCPTRFSSHFLLNNMTNKQFSFPNTVAPSRESQKVSLNSIF